MNTPNTDKLLAVIDRFKVIKRIDFENHDHRKFVGEVFLACKEARPEIDALKLLAVRPVPPITVPLIADPTIESDIPWSEASQQLSQKLENPLLLAKPVGEIAISNARKAATKGKTRLKVGGDGPGANLEEKIS